MDLPTFINKVIDRGIEGAKESYDEDSPKLKGSVEGFEACRGKTPEEIFKLYQSCGTDLMQYYANNNVDLYWEKNCFRLEVEWVLNCVSAVLYNQGLPPLIPPTARGVLNANEILTS